MRPCHFAILCAACSSAKPAPAPPSTPWSVPAGWKHEAIPFPLEFAPALAHRGTEELRFAPGFFKREAPGYWSYAFVWRTDDPAQLDAAAFATELTGYFRGLIAAVDGDKRKTEPSTIVVTATAGERIALTAKVADAFGDGAPVELAGWARRDPCAKGALWVVVLAPPTSGVRGELDQLAATAACDQPILPNEPK